ncbi:MAG: MFS transporter [Bacteroidetes bacterium]|nr:MFS transporter [Bacteroidota bacterium]
MHSTTSDTNKLNDPKIISAWAFYDWANSAFALVITTAIFPAYYLAVTNDMIHIAGLIVPNSALYAFTITIAYIILTLASPLLSGMADYGGRKKQFLLFFTLIGSISCIGLFFFQGMNQIFLGTLLFLLGLIGFAGGLVFYNAFLPEIASPDQYDRVSAKGFSLGFLGSLILLSFCLLMIQKPGIIGVEEGTTLPVRLSFVLVGIWWLFFSLRSLAMLPGQSNHKPYDNPFKNGINAFLKVWKSSKQFPELYKFLFSFFTYSAGVQTILYMAATFAEKELHFETSELILVILFIQLLGILGAYIASRCSIKWGNKITLMFILFIWTIVCIVAYMTYVKSHFYFLAASVGFVMGAVQSLSRSTYAKLIPKQTADHTSYFSLYDILEKAAIILGTFIFGFLNHLTGSMRFSILFLSAIFILSIFLFSRIKMKNEA